MKTTWLLAADEAVARILELPDEGGDLVPVEELADPDAHASEAEMHRSPHGRRAAGGTGMIGHAAVSAGDNQRHLQAQAFAGRIAGRLLQCLQEKRYDELHVVAAPRLLGYLRQALHPTVAAVIASEQDKDVVHESAAQLTQRLTAAAGARP